MFVCPIGHNAVGCHAAAMTTRNRLCLATFVYLTAFIVVLASEKAYWYWSAFTVDSMLALAGFYVLPTMAGLWALALAPAVRLHQVILAGAIFAFVVEGVLTPVVYIDGPLPVMAAMFTGWHGLIAFVGFWYLVRRWLLARQLRYLASGSLLFGVIWGLWALSSAVVSPLEAEEVADLGFEPALLTPGGFLIYAGLVGTSLLLAHWLIGFVWPAQWAPGKNSTRVLFVVSGLYMGFAVLPAVLWAPLKLAVLVGGAWKLLRMKGGAAGESGPTILAGLHGRVRFADTAVLLLMALAAAVVYGVVWPLRDSENVMGGVYWSLVTAQIVAGVVALTWAWRRAMRERQAASEKSTQISVK
jgi:hypothetical protein